MLFSKAKSIAPAKKLGRFHCKRFLSIDEAKSQILSHPTVVKHIKNYSSSLIENTKSLTECYHTLLSPILAKLEESEILELQKYVLEKASSLEFGISDFLLREIISSKGFCHKSDRISSSVFEDLVKLNPGRRISHLEYLGELQRLNVDILSKNSNIMMFTFNSIMGSSKVEKDAELVSKLTQLVYVFTNMSPENLSKCFSSMSIDEFIEMLIDSNSTRLLELALDKILEVGCGSSLFKTTKKSDAKSLTPYQHFLILRFELLGSKEKNKQTVALKYLEFVKKNGPYFALSDGEKLSTETSQAEEHLLYRELSLKNKLNIKTFKNYFCDTVKLFSNNSFGDALKNNKGKSYLERILYLNDPENFASLDNGNGDRFEKAFRYYHSIISGRLSYSLKEVQEHYLAANNIDNFTEIELFKIQQLQMLAMCVMSSSDETKDYIIELMNENVAKYLKTECCFDFIKAFIVSILMTKDADLAIYIKEGFYNNGSLTISDMKKLNKFFVSYGDFSEGNKQVTRVGTFKRNMQDLILDEIVNRI